MTPSSTQVDESVASLVAAFTLMARRFPGGRVDRLEGVAVLWADVPLPFLNLGIVDSPCADGDERHPWLGCLCEEWVPDDWRDVVADAGMHVSMPLTGMLAERILPPRRPAPALELRRVADERSRRAAAELNNAAYGLPEGLCDCLIDPAFWPDDMHGYVGAVDGQDVTTTSVFAVRGTLYVALVATHPEHGRKGYAEHAMRHALSEGAAALGLQRSILHASEAGRPVYKAMGYEDTARFALLTTEPPAEL